jgi:hypothetical protein
VIRAGPVGEAKVGEQEAGGELGHLS